MFSVEFFSKIALGYSIAGIILWLSDFGSNNWILLQFGGKRFDELRIEWTYKFVRVILSGALISSAIFVFKSDAALALIVFACLLDLDADTNLGIRQLLYPLKYAVVLHSLKKISQLMLFLLWFIMDSSDNLYLFSLFLVSPVIILKFIDTRKIGGFEFKRMKARKEKSLPMWLQGGYTSLINLDLIILAYFQEYELIATLAIGKKLLSSLYIFGSTLFTETLGQLHDAPKNSEISFKGDTLNHTVILSGLASISIIVFLNPILTLLSPEQQDTLSRSVIISIVLATPFSIPGSYFNAILLKRNLFFFSAIQGFVSALLYLLCLLLIGGIGHAATGIIVGFYVKTFSEFAFGRIFIANKRRSRH